MGEIANAFTAWLIGGMMGASLVVLAQDCGADYKPTSAKQGDCVIEERVHEPVYRLVCDGRVK